MSLIKFGIGRMIVSSKSEIVFEVNIFGQLFSKWNFFGDLLEVLLTFAVSVKFVRFSVPE